MARRRREYGSDSAFDYSDGGVFGCLPILALGLLLDAIGVWLLLAVLA